MKILFFIYSMHCGGAERVTANLANEWAALGWDVDIVSLRPVGQDFYPLNPAIRRMQLEYTGEGGGLAGGLLANVRRVAALRHMLQRGKPDFVMGVMTTASVLAILAARGLPVKVVATEHTHPPMLPLNRLWKRLRRWSYPHADSVVALTADSRKWLEAHCGCSNVSVIPPPLVLPLDRSEPVSMPDGVVAHGRRMLLAAGRLSPEKGFADLIGAFSQIAADCPQWDLVILGEGGERRALERLVRERGIGARVRLCGRVGNVADWYQRADLYALSSRYEGFPLALAEAMASGCAAVSYDCDTGPREIIEQGSNGLLVKAGNKQALAKALRALMTHDADRERMAARAASVGERFSVKRTGAMWHELFASLGGREEPRSAGAAARGASVHRP